MTKKFIWTKFALFLSLIVQCTTNDDPKWKDFFVVGPNDQPYYVRDDDQSLRLPCAVAPQYANDPLFIKEWFFVGGSGPQIITTNNENRRPDLYDIETQRSDCNGCYNLKIKRIKYDLNNGKFYCQLSKIDLLIRAPVANVVVLVKPGHPSISTQKLSLNEGTFGRMVCETAGGNPAPEIRWFFSNGTETTDFALQTNATDLINPTISVLQWPVSANDHQREISCLVRNEAMQPTDLPLMARSGALNVFYSPIVKTEPNSPYNVISGHSAKLKCEADANPPVTKYSWNFNNGDLSYAGSTINIVVNRSLAGNYTCFAENIDSKKAHGSLFVNVLYAPEISVPSEIRAAVGRKVSLSCSSESNPAPTSISWSFPDGRTVEGRSLAIESIALRDAGNYTCTVKNHLIPTNEAAIEGSSSKSTTVLVDHPPGKASISLTGAASSTTVVIINSTANLTCKAIDPGSPAAVYRWRRPNDADFEQSTRSVLTIYEAKLSDSGIYSCLPFNAIDKGEIGTYNLTVYDPAVIENRLNLEDTVTENETINHTLTCSARGFPVPNITWYKDGGMVLESDHWAVVNELPSNIRCQFGEYCARQIRSTLRWKNSVKWSDKGVFSCGAHNGAGDMEKSSILLRVFHKPVVVNDPSRPFVAADIGKSAEIHCRTTSMPEPTFTWFKNGEFLPNTFDYTISSRRQNHSVPDLHESFLSIRRLTETDMGDYVCKATNKFGSGSFIFTVQGRTKPTAPSEFRTLQITHQWIALQWKPGFDGGSDQIFTVEVVYPWNTPVQYVDIPENLHDFRHKRHARIETAAPNILNVTSDVIPNAEYKFRIKSKNDIGETEWSAHMSVWSADAPLDLSVQKVVKSTIDHATMTLDVFPNNVDPDEFCLLAYVKQFDTSKYTAVKCVSPSQKIDNLPDQISNVKVRFCRIHSMDCGEPYEIVVDDPSSGVTMSWVTTLIIVGPIVLVLVIFVVFPIRSRCYRRFKSAESCEKKKYLSSTSYDKDYEFESNQCHSKTISGPYLTKETPGPPSAFGSLEKRTLTTGSKDSGVFTAYGSSMVNNQADPSGRYSIDHVDTKHYLSSSVRRPSYEAETGNWHSNEVFSGTFNRHSHDNHNSSNQTSSPSLNYFPSNGNGPELVDMNPNPSGLSAIPRHDGCSINSAYSTPSQRRVIREIVV